MFINVCEIFPMNSLLEHFGFRNQMSYATYYLLDH